jgi:hypothetical protein
MESAIAVATNCRSRTPSQNAVQSPDVHRRSVATICRTKQHVFPARLRRSAAVIHASRREAARRLSRRRLTPLKNLRVMVMSIERDELRTQRHRCCVSPSGMSGEVAAAHRYYATYWKNYAWNLSRSTAGAALRRSRPPLACRTPQIPDEMEIAGNGLGTDSRADDARSGRFPDVLRVAERHGRASAANAVGGVPGSEAGSGSL